MAIMDPNLDSLLDFENSEVQRYCFAFFFFPVRSMKVTNYIISLQQEMKFTNKFPASFVTN